MGHATTIRIAAIIAAAALLSATAPAQTAEDIVSRMNQHDRERMSALTHYGSQRTYHVEYHGPLGNHAADLQARMDFSAPDQKHFTVISESGSETVCHKVLDKLMETEQEGALEANHIRFMLSPENYDLKLIGDDDIDGVKAWQIEVTPHANTRFTYKGKVWISKADYAVIRITGEPAKNPSFWVSNATFDYRYGRNGEFWLPQHGETVSHMRMGGEAKLTVDYGTYEIDATPSTARAASSTSHAKSTSLASTAIALR